MRRRHQRRKLRRLLGRTLTQVQKPTRRAGEKGRNRRKRIEQRCRAAGHPPVREGATRCRCWTENFATRRTS